MYVLKVWIAGFVVGSLVIATVFSNNRDGHPPFFSFYQGLLVYGVYSAVFSIPSMLLVWLLKVKIDKTSWVERSKIVFLEVSGLGLTVLPLLIVLGWRYNSEVFILLLSYLVPIVIAIYLFYPKAGKAGSDVVIVGNSLEGEGFEL